MVITSDYSLRSAQNTIFKWRSRRKLYTLCTISDVITILKTLIGWQSPCATAGPTGPANNTSSHWTEAFNGYGLRPAGWRTPGNRGAGLGRASCRRSECGRAGLAGVARRGRPTQDWRTNGSTRGGQPEKRGADGRVGLHNAGGLAGPTQGGLSER